MLETKTLSDGSNDRQIRKDSQVSAVTNPQKPTGNDYDPDLRQKILAVTINYWGTPMKSQ